MKPQSWLDLYALTWRLPVIVWQLLFFIGPLLFMLAMSFFLVKNYRMVEAFEMANWAKMFSRGYFWDAYLLTLVLAVTATLLATCLAFPAAYGLAFKVSENTRRWLIFLLIIPFFTSYLVRTFSWYVILAESGVINALLETLGLGPYTMLNTRFGTMVGYMTLTLPLVIILQTLSLANIDKNLIEAAHNLGAGAVRTIITVVIPSAKTGLIIGAVFCFILSFGDFVAPYYLGGSKPPTLPILIIDTTKSGQQWPRAAVIAVVMMVTLLIAAFSAIALAYRQPKKTMNSDRLIKWSLWVYLAMVFCFVFTPIITSVIFSFNSDRFPTLPLGSFTFKWYQTVLNDPDVWDAAKTSLLVSLCTGILATFIGFCTAYTDYRYQFRFKGAYLALSLLPPTIPLIILALAMLAWFSRIGVSGHIGSIIIAHTVLCAPFAMAIVRLRLQQMDADLEAAAWNLGASEWAAMKTVVVPFVRPALISSLCLTMAVSFDEFAVAWFVSGLNKTIPVLILEILQGNIDPQINAIGTFVFVTSMTLIIIAQVFFVVRSKPARNKVTD